MFKTIINWLKDPFGAMAIKYPDYLPGGPEVTFRDKVYTTDEASGTFPLQYPGPY